MKTWSTVAVGGGVTVTLIFCLQFAPLLLSSSHHEIHHVSEEELNKIERYATSTTTTTMNLPHDRNLATTPSKTCVQGYAGDDLSTVNPFPKPMVIDPLRPLNYCGEFDNDAAIMEIDQSLCCKFHCFKPLDRKDYRIKRAQTPAKVK